MIGETLSSLHTPKRMQFIRSFVTLLSVVCHVILCVDLDSGGSDIGHCVTVQLLCKSDDRPIPDVLDLLRTAFAGKQSHH